MKISATHRLATLGMLAAATLALPTYAASPMDAIGQQLGGLKQAGQDKLQEMQGKNERHGDKHDRHDREHGHHGDQHKPHQNNETCRQEIGARSVQGDTATQMRFINASRQEVRTYWLDYKGQRVFYRAIPAGGQYLQPTFKTHPWVITDANDKCLNVVTSQQPYLAYTIR